jgi:hypothetical protein
MLPRGLEKLVYRIYDDFLRYAPNGRFREIGIIRGNYDSRHHRWFFTADVGYMQQPKLTFDAIELYDRYSIPTPVDEILIGPFREGMVHPDVELLSNGRVWHVPTAQPISTLDYKSDQIRSLSPGQIVYMDSPVAVSNERRNKSWQQEYLSIYEDAVGKYVMGVDLAAEPEPEPEPEPEDRKKKLAASRPERLARLWKAKYERTGVKPLISKLKLE